MSIFLYMTCKMSKI